MLGIEDGEHWPRQLAANGNDQEMRHSAGVDMLILVLMRTPNTAHH